MIKYCCDFCEKPFFSQSDLTKIRVPHLIPGSLNTIVSDKEICHECLVKLAEKLIDF